ncbi:cupin domain-containing protein [Olivibacter sp. SDN3]|uniref:glucose-6-phosphate isomerase family protein n=1 Tax=Olivibacter sp. SDN3 TaxID=2764720 RepID=UPI0016518492|nr:glucose-6-phosphate isomerase family protein [Olivibacter sp. SDN3]QNL51545.1 cupin domain-containing protein [Olivibacter sp. SDN3]
MLQQPAITFSVDVLKGKEVITKSTYLADLTNLFKNEEARLDMPQDQLIYRVTLYKPVAEGTPGGLFFGTTIIEPGQIATEYFMTRGHFHARGDRAEYYWCIQGEGALLLMDRKRNIRAERMYPGSLHYIPAHTAHRTINTSTEPLSFGACWPADAGYDYEGIAHHGFSGRIFQVDNVPQLVKL